MTRTPKNPAAEVTPVPHRRVARTVPGEPAVAPGPPRGTAAGGKTSTQPQERAAAGTTAPAPVTGDADPGFTHASPGRGRTQTPAGGAPASHRAADSAPPAGQGLRGKEARDAIKRAQSEWNAAKRRGRFRRAPKRTGPGMIRRDPPETPQGAA